MEVDFIGGFPKQLTLQLKILILILVGKRT